MTDTFDDWRGALARKDARIAEIEAECRDLGDALDRSQRAAGKAEACLAAVIALCDMHKPEPGCDIPFWRVDEFRAAATGDPS